ncbi:patatin-like phospholipase family protein [Tuwongella immobilis]|uniref:PNPLA domain-containing protein n=1 Tax=Tuwongella immobilis TaxID=692036 RepID=A0A6C2YIH0_9BACT|nr:patatin-like phospholipase family protein [Tuwongella immobilis]VIP01338.1 lipoprotein : Putative uncharacterized protein OS=Yersinia aldovae ATCC 35236 GN=yaldo0001_35880 PE=4 SV=1: Patatin [Tuwongella immobilis]VTR98107.1 lipoprotein : Putative uncharacterized protein OS=Yersinia aldovae ATCC 35236 GN=yaldo0001_35880 PE=4 SV=1: Patatin [Tuwongella immobilis]
MRWQNRIGMILLSLVAGCMPYRQIAAETVVESPAAVAAVPTPATDPLPDEGDLVHLVKRTRERIAQVDRQLAPPVGPMPATPRGPRSILALSGGGRNGAFTAGVLAGWTLSGTRPQFDIVTGVSTGALIAPLAFLGPEYDSVMAHEYTNVTDRDIFRVRLLPLLFRRQSLTDVSPLRDRLGRIVTEPFLDAIAQRHRTGARLYIGTTDLSRKQLVIWDLGAVAASGHPQRRERFIALLLASCAVPGLFPPVSIELLRGGEPVTEMHVDGGVIASSFVEPFMLSDGQTGFVPADVYVISAGRVGMSQSTVRPVVWNILTESMVAVLQARTHADLIGTYLLAEMTGGRFFLSALHPSEMRGNNSLSFEPREMRRLYQLGVADGQAQRWRTTPPGLSTEEQRRPRDASVFPN